MSDPFSRDDNGEPDYPASPALREGGIAARARAAAAGAPRYLDALNPEQREAVETLDGPVLVLAGAGTGKTRVLTTRIAHIVATGRAYPSQILAVTFTNKAAREMKERVGMLAGPGAEGMPWLGTFHAISTKILRRHAELVGLKSGFTILDMDDQIRLIKQVLQAENVDDKRWPARQFAIQLDNWKNRGLDPAHVPAGEGEAFANGKGRKLYEFYQQRLKILNAADFGDLLLECVRLFKENPDILADYQKRFRYILVDEYQDTNTVQYLWLRLLAQKTDENKQQNLCCVGDDDQCVAEGTLVTLPDGSQTPIETISAGQEILSCFGSSDFRAAKVLRKHQSKARTSMVRILLASGNILETTPGHTHFAGYRQGLSPQTYFVYMMYKSGFGYRLGTSQVYTRGQKQPVLGYMQRAVQEHADALWIVSSHESENEARFEEIRLSLTYAIPTLPFTARKGGSTKGLAHDETMIRKLYASVETETAGPRLLKAAGLSVKEPHHLPQSRNSLRRNITLTLCGDHRGATPMHRISMTGNDVEGARKLRALGLSVRSSRKGSASWRFETANANWRTLLDIITSLRDAFDIKVICNARLGGDNGGTGAKASNSLPFVRASSLRKGMAVFTANGYDVIQDIVSVDRPTQVYDIDVEQTHNYIANGIVTHNSVYGWRGAEVENILRFDKDFPGAKVIRLERNYRSTAHILAAASHLITHNDDRLGKTLFTDGQDGEKPGVCGVWDSEEEARVIGEDIEQLQRQGQSLDEIAILVRASFQMREFEERFITLGMPYRVIGGPRFYERMEIRDALAYLRCVAQPQDDLAFERIFNTPKRGLGNATLKILHDNARLSQIPLMQSARMLIETEELKPKQRQTIRRLLGDFDRWSSLLGSTPHHELAETVLEESGYTDMWQKDRSADAAGRLENLKELIRSMEEFPDLAGFLEHISLVMDTENTESEERVSIMTLHGAKGLEFETVYLPGWEEGLFPHQRSLDDQGRAGLEEERRLAYVGITRAKQRARIYFATNRRIRGLWQTTIPSRFLDELPADHVEVLESTQGNYGGYAVSRFNSTDTFGSNYTSPGWKRAQTRKSNPSSAADGARAAPKTIEGELVAKSTGTSALEKGARVFHIKFGMGRVAAIDGNKLTVDFDKAGRKMVLESFLEAK